MFGWLAHIICKRTCTERIEPQPLKQSEAPLLFSTSSQIHTVSRHQTSESAQRHEETSLQSPSSNAAIKLLHRSFLPASGRFTTQRREAAGSPFAGAQQRFAAALFVGWKEIVEKIYFWLFTCTFKAKKRLH